MSQPERPTSGIRSCYGQYNQRRPQCEKCELAGYCRTFADNDRMESFGCSHRIAVITDRVPAAEKTEKTQESKEYTPSDMAELVSYFLTLDVWEFRALQLKLRQPELTNDIIAEIVGVGRNVLYRFFRRQRIERPAMAKLLYCHKTKRNIKQ